MTKLLMMVITGGPCGGKSSVLTKLTEVFSDLIAVVPEAATQLLNVCPVPERDCPLSDTWLRIFQPAVYHTQIAAEDGWALLGKRLLVCDRGAMDGAGYLKDKELFLSLIGQQEETILQRYWTVIHLESLAVGQPEKYLKLKQSNPNRYEGVVEARAVDVSICAAWANHPRQIILSSLDSLEHKEEFVINLIREGIGHE